MELICPWTIWKSQTCPPPSKKFIWRSKKCPQLLLNPCIHAFVKQVTQEIENFDKTRPSSSNLTRDQKQALENLSKNQQITIKPVDKGGNIVVMNNSFYEDICRRILFNRNWYRPIFLSCINNFKLELHRILDDTCFLVSYKKTPGNTSEWRDQHCQPFIPFRWSTNPFNNHQVDQVRRQLGWWPST